MPITVSALLFAVMHLDLYKLPITFIMGLVFGYIYTKTGRLRYSIILHMCINFLGSVVSTFVVSKVDFESFEEITQISDTAELIDSGFLIFGAYILVMLVLFILGWIVFFANLRKLELPPSTMPIMKKERFKTAYLNAGFICIVLYFIFSTVITFVDLGGLL